MTNLGAGNSFLGGLSAGLLLTKGDVFEGKGFNVTRKLLTENTVCFQATLHATVSASLVIEQLGLPKLKKTAGGEFWNEDSPVSRLFKLMDR